MIFTVGHSTRALDQLLAILTGHGVTGIIDVRTVPRSARNPQFNRDSLPGELAAVGIAYAHMPELGGLRKARVGSVNLGWQDESFRGYADYMQTLEFDAAIERLIEVTVGAAGAPPPASPGQLRSEPLRGSVPAPIPPPLCAIMCAEALPWRCHRSLIADSLTARGHSIQHILDASNLRPHEMTPFARVEGSRVTYPALGI